MAKKKKGNVLLVKMKSSESGHFYVTRKNRKNVTGKFEFKKYDPFVKRHVIYKEGKL